MVPFFFYIFCISFAGQSWAPYVYLLWCWHFQTPSAMPLNQQLPPISWPLGTSTSKLLSWLFPVRCHLLNANFFTFMFLCTSTFHPNHLSFLPVLPVLISWKYFSLRNYIRIYILKSHLLAFQNFMRFMTTQFFYFRYSTVIITVTNILSDMQESSFIKL